MVVEIAVWDFVFLLFPPFFEAQLSVVCVGINMA